MKNFFTKKDNSKKKIQGKQLGIRDFVMILIRSRIPWIWVAALFVFNLLFNRLLLSIPVTTGRLLGGDLSAGALSEALLSYLYMALFAIIQFLIRAFTYSTTAKNARFQLWGRMLRISEVFYDKVDSSEMLTAVTYDIASAIPDMVTLIVSVIPDIIYVVRAMLLIKSYDLLLLLILLLFLPLKYLYMVIVGRWVYRTEARLRQTTGVLTSRLDERLKNISLIKTFNREEKEAANGGAFIDDLYKANVAIAKLGGISLSVQQGIELLEKFIMMVVAVILLQNGRIDIAQWVAFFMFSTNLGQKLDTLIEDWTNAKNIAGNLERTSKLYHAPIEDMNENGADMADDKGYAISFDDVSFSYENKKALNHVSFHIKEGSKVAIVGKSGSGKSTALSLMERFYDPEEGEISVGGISISAFKLADYRKHIAYVPQLHKVFSGTVREALIYGNENTIPDEIILENAKETGFDQYIMLQKKGLDAPVSADTMSGGQLQKLIITREKMRNSKIVLLDEPVSALDAESTLLIKDLVTEKLGDKTVIMVTHDLSFIDSMDQIIMLNDGEMIAAGTYEELLKNSEPFCELLASQGREVTA